MRGLTASNDWSAELEALRTFQDPALHGLFEEISAVLWPEEDPTATGLIRPGVSAGSRTERLDAAWDILSALRDGRFSEVERALTPVRETSPNDTVSSDALGVTGAIEGAIIGGAIGGPAGVLVGGILGAVIGWGVGELINSATSDSADVEPDGPVFRDHPSAKGDPPRWIVRFAIRPEAPPQ